MLRARPKKLTRLAKSKTSPPMNPKSLRNRNRVIDTIVGVYKKNISDPDVAQIHKIYNDYTMFNEFTMEELESFHKRLDNALMNHFRDWIEPKLAERILHINDIEDIIIKQPFSDYRDLLWSLYDLWSITYKGPVASLADIAANSQNIHAHEVLKSTTDGILHLSRVDVPANQKTLKEIAEAFMTYPEFDAAKEILSFYSKNPDLYSKLSPELREKINAEFLAIKAEAIKEIQEHDDFVRANESYMHKIREYMQTQKASMRKLKLHLFKNEIIKNEIFKNEMTQEIVLQKASMRKRNVHLFKKETSQKETPQEIVLELLALHWYKLERGTLLSLRNEYFAVYYARKSAVETTIKDMRDWGSRESVMKKGENVYKTTLRGVWAKIKTDPAYKELVNRLWEECSEAVSLCADGHVGRLCNVFVGFDDAFKNSLSPMEYFQNKIALISESAAPLDIRIEQARKLMDDINMPEGEREPWLDALA